MNNTCSYALLIVAFLNPFSLQAMEQKDPGKLKIPALFTQDDAKTAKKTDIVQEIPAQYQADCAMLMNAYIYKKKSLYFNPQYKFPYMVGGKLLLEAALKNKDTQACVHLLANGSLDTANKQNLLYDALRNGYYPFCHLLLTTGQAKAHFEGMERKTPFYWVLAHGSTLPPADLLALCNLLRQRGADINKPLKDGRYIFESLAVNLDQISFYRIFPVLKQLGLSPELQDDQGFTPVHRLAQNFTSLHKNVRVNGLINLIIPYQVYQERRTALTILALQKFRRASLLGQAQKDVMREHIVALLCPFRRRLLHETVNQQLALLHKLLTIKNNLQRTPQDVAQIIHQDNSDTLNPQEVEQHRAAFTKATQKLMAALDAPRT